MINRIVILFNLILLPYLGIAQQGIPFENGSFKQALAKAKSQNKLLFIDGYAQWCAPCKRMAKTVFLEKEVGDFFKQNIVSITVDIEKGEGPQIKKKYGIQGLPGYVFVDGNDQVVYRFSSAMDADKFLKEAKLAVSYANDPNSLGRLGERYAKNKKDENLTRAYLDRLYDQRNLGNYVDVLENYLNIQKSIPETSKDMVLLLAKYNKQIVFGGTADQIVKRNLGSEEWDKYVRKDVREAYQKMPKLMIETTTEYAISKRDTTLLELALKNAGKIGVEVDQAQRDKTYAYYYKKTDQGDKYKALVHDNNVAFINSLDQKTLHDTYLRVMKLQAEGDAEALRLVPHSVRFSEQIFAMVKDYVPYIETDKEKKEVLSWMKVAYDIRPGEAQTMSNYADVLYLLGNKNEALKIKEESYVQGQKEGMKRLSTIKINLDLMKTGKQIEL